MLLWYENMIVVLCVCVCIIRFVLFDDKGDESKIMEKTVLSMWW